jgi:exodeoxyribonuclease VII small subunit
MVKKDKKLSFEEKLKELEDITRKLDDPSFPLESSLELFEKGVKLGRELHLELEASKLKVQKLMENGAVIPIDSSFSDNASEGRDD